MLAEDIKARILLNLAKGSVARMDAAWDLAGFAAERVYTQFQNADGRPYFSVRQWWKGELSSYVPWDEINGLMRMGQALYPIRPQVDQALRERKRTFGWFKRAKGFLEDGSTTLDEIGRCALAGVPLACEMLQATRKRQNADVLKFVLSSNGQEKQRLVARLTRFAIAHGFESQEEALLGILRGIDGDLPADYRRFADKIQSGPFLCRVCRKIPNPPAVTTAANGKDAPVCAEPCKAIYEAKVVGKKTDE